MDFRGFSQTRETEPVSPEAFARGYKLFNLQPCSFVAADSLICSLVLQPWYRFVAADVFGYQNSGFGWPGSIQGKPTSSPGWPRARIQIT